MLCCLGLRKSDVSFVEREKEMELVERFVLEKERYVYFIRNN